MKCVKGNDYRASIWFRNFDDSPVSQKSMPSPSLANQKDAISFFGDSIGPERPPLPNSAVLGQFIDQPSYIAFSPASALYFPGWSPSNQKCRHLSSLCLTAHLRFRHENNVAQYQEDSSATKLADLPTPAFEEVHTLNCEAGLVSREARPRSPRNIPPTE